MDGKPGLILTTWSLLVIQIQRKDLPHKLDTKNKRNKMLEEKNDLNIQPTSILSDALNARLKQKSKGTEEKKTYCPSCDTLLDNPEKRPFICFHCRHRETSTKKSLRSVLPSSYSYRTLEKLQNHRKANDSHCHPNFEIFQKDVYIP